MKEGTTSLGSPGSLQSASLLRICSLRDQYSRCGNRSWGASLARQPSQWPRRNSCCPYNGPGRVPSQSEGWDLEAEGVTGKEKI